MHVQDGGDRVGNKKTATFAMRMTPAKKERMEEFFEELGLSLAYGVNIFFEHAIMAAGLPFEVKLNGEKKTVFSEEELSGPRTAQLAIRLDPYKKSQIEYTFKELGMTVSEAVNIYFEQCLLEWGIPFRVGYPKPNETTLAVMRETAEREAKGIRPEKTYSSVEELFKDLDADD